MSRMLIVECLGVLLMLVSAVRGYAGNLDSPGDPSAGSAMPTTTDIYIQLDTGATSTPAGSFQAPVAGPDSSGRNLSEIQAKLPAPDNANGAVPTEVASGKTFWGLQGGSWGNQTGTMPMGNNISGTDGELSITIPSGYYSGSEIATAQDSSLRPEYIVDGITIFGVEGSYSCIKCNGICSGSPLVCNGKGHCIATDTCDCFGDYSGFECEIPPFCYGIIQTSPSVCSGHGICVGQDMCYCDNNFGGPECNIPY